MFFCMNNIKQENTVYFLGKWNQNQQSELPRRHPKKEIIPWVSLHLENGDWTYQHDSPPVRKAKMAQMWCANNSLDFFSAEEWPLHSPDLNAMDYSIWSMLTSKVYAHTTSYDTASLQRALKKGDWWRGPACRHRCVLSRDWRLEFVPFWNLTAFYMCLVDNNKYYDFHRICFKAAVCAAS